MRFHKALRRVAAVVAGVVAAVTVLVQPASARPVVINTSPYFNMLAIGKAMAVLNASTAEAAPVVQAFYTRAEPNNDLISREIETEASGIFRLKPAHTLTLQDGNVHNDKCLAVYGNRRGNGVPIVNATCTYDNINNDVWTEYFVDRHGGWAFQNQSTGTCIATQNASTANLAPLVAWECNDTQNSVWILGAL